MKDQLGEKIIANILFYWRADKCTETFHLIDCLVAGECISAVCSRERLDSIDPPTPARGHYPVTAMRSQRETKGRLGGCVPESIIRNPESWT